MLIKITLLCAVLALIAFLAAPRAIPAVLAWHRPDITFLVSTEEKRMFITIDDAPSAATSDILQVLRKHQASATFFIIADRVKSPTQLEEIISAGCSLGNHLKTTKACSELSFAEFRSDFDACATLLEKAGRSRLFRPASDFGTEEQIAYARSRGHLAVLGTVFPMDHWISDAGLLATFARWLAVPGGIVILHDGDVRGPTTAQVLDRLIPRLREAGYSFGRLEEPNQALQPTRMLGTSPAEQARVPSTRVADL